MAASVKEIFKEASELPEADRAKLAGLLLDSIEPDPVEDLDAAWAAEIKRRVAQLDSGSVKTTSWEEVRAKLWARLHGD